MKPMHKQLFLGILAFLGLGPGNTLTAAEKGDSFLLYQRNSKETEKEARFGSSVNEYYVDLARRNFAERARRLESIRTRRQAEEYVREIREKVSGLFAFPERTPLNAVVTGKNAYPDYTVENLYYFSRPGYPVTANFYLPAHYTGKLQAVLMLCGHSEYGKGDGDYRRVCLHLVRCGFAVLIPDPVEQGERLQFRAFRDKAFGLCGNHNLLGKNLLLCGEWFGSWRTWDAIRGLDYLQTRPEIDPEKLYVTGNSGGGTLTTLVAAADPRPVAVAPSCYVTSWKHNIENELPSDFEQMPPRALAMGLEMGDLLLAQAPRRILILGQKKDFFDPRGVVETFQEVRKINSLLGGETECFIGPREHGFSQENREATCRFFTGKEYSEPVLKLPPRESTWALPEGKVENLPGNQMLRTLTEKKSAELAAKREKLAPDALRAKLRELLALDAPAIPYYRVLRPCRRGTLIGSRFALETENNAVTAILTRSSRDLFYDLETKAEKITLAVTSPNCAAKGKERIPAAGEILYFIDPRGTGECTPSGTDLPDKRNFFDAYGFDYHYASVALMFGKPILGKRVYDILCALELLGKDGAEITLEADGLGCIPGLMAAVLSDRVRHVRFTAMPPSYAELLKIPVSDFPLSFMVPGILRHFDLPDLLELLKRQGKL